MRKTNEEGEYLMKMKEDPSLICKKDRQSLIEQENRERTERLASKVSALKSFTLDMESEAKEHNRFLDDMDSGFDSTFGFLVSGRHRVNRLLQSNRSNRTLLCYLSLVVSSLLLILYFILFRSSPSIQ